MSDNNRIWAVSKNAYGCWKWTCRLLGSLDHARQINSQSPVAGLLGIEDVYEIDCTSDPDSE